MRHCMRDCVQYWVGAGLDAAMVWLDGGLGMLSEMVRDKFGHMVRHVVGCLVRRLMARCVA